ncbi:HNH endonuclease [Micromonospora sp. CA-246542]|uniref:HNH endonuclease n=1 Tax=Micromonospora sp. CA-246542 TaxID=3239959 RepID=UPI003D8D65D0
MKGGNAMPELKGNGSTTRWRKLRAYVLERDGERCMVQLPGCTVYARMAVKDEAHVDHIIPRQMGGTDDVGNLRASCRACNLARKRIVVRDEPEPKRISRW